jgi:hypothetical protein
MADIVSTALGWLGVPYSYGGTSRSGVDCSGLVQQVFASLGYQIGRDTVAQFNDPRGLTVGSLAEAQPGDLIFFGAPSGGVNEHVGIYLGADQMISAPHTGASVRIDSVTGWASSGEPLLGIKRYLIPGTNSDAGTAGTLLAADTTAPSSVTGAATASVGHLVGEALLVAGGVALIVLGVHRAAHRSQP